MTTLQDRSEPGPAGSPLEDAHCPHCGGRMASAVALPWPEQPTLCPSCQRWVGRARAVGAAAPEGGEDPNGGPSASETRGPTKRGRPGSAERRRARELARGGSPAGAAAATPVAAEEAVAPAGTAAPEPNGAAAPTPDAAAEPAGAAAATPNGAAGEEVAHEDATAEAAGGQADGTADDATAFASAPEAAADETVVEGPAPAATGSPDAYAPAHGGNGADAEPLPASEPVHTLPFAPLVEEPRRRRLRLPRLRRRSAEQPVAPSPLSAPPGPERPRRSRLLRALPFVLLVIGGLLLVEGAVTVLWKEPFSALLTAQSQGELGDKLKQMEEQAAAEEARNRKQLAGYQHRRAVQVNRSTTPGEPLGRLRIPKLDLSTVVVQSTAESSLTKGPAHYTETPLPGQRGNWTVGIAGHRTTYDAPFRRINELKRGNEIIFTLPYGRFTYEVSKTRIVDAGYMKAFVPQGKKMIVLTACHPLYSAAQRILVYGTLTKAEPRGAATRAVGRT